MGDIQIYDVGGAWLVDFFKPAGQYQISLSKTAEKNQAGEDCDTSTKTALKTFIINNKTWLKGRMVLLGQPKDSDSI